MLRHGYKHSVMNWSPNSFFRSLLAAFLFSLASIAGARADLTVEQVNQAKAATAILLYGDIYFGAVCISESGIFLTNYQTSVRYDVEKLTVITDPSGKNEKRHRVKEVRQFEREGLAFVVAEVDGKMPALSLGEISALKETEQLCILGYPSKPIGDNAQTAYPVVGTHIARVSALRRINNREEIEMDSHVRPGTSGGPVLNEKGQLVGIMPASDPTRGTNIAISVSNLNRISDILNQRRIAPSDEPREIKLPAPFGEVAVAGNGKTLLLRLDSMKKLAVFDVPSLKIRGYITLASSAALFAGGSRHILVGYPSEGVLQRYSLETLEKAGSMTIPTGLKTIAMGYSSPDIALVVLETTRRTADVRILNADRLAFVADSTGFELDGGIRDVSLWSPVRASADGRTFGFGSTQGGGENFTLITYRYGKGVIFTRSFHGGTLLPNVDGSAIFSTWGAVYAPNGVPFFESPGTTYDDGEALIPAYQSPYFFGVIYEYSSQTECPARAISIHQNRSKEPLALWKALPEMTFRESKREGLLTIDQRYHFFPQLNLFLTLPPTNDRLMVRTLNLPQILKAKGVGYLYVTSVAPPARAGQPFEYQLEAASGAGGVTFSLQAGPEGMAIATAGKVTWSPDKPGEEPVTVSLKDSSGQEVYHRFLVVVTP